VGAIGQTAVIIRTRLPVGLERLRRQSVAEAARGLPAHATLLYPFLEPRLLDADVRRRIADVAARSGSFEYRLAGAGHWPEVVFVAVEPIEPFVALQAALAATFPAYPIYGEPPGFTFIPHVTVAEGPDTDVPAALAHPGWGQVPRRARATALEVIAGKGRGWRLVWRVRLGPRAHR
jgi:2'-5' RNA ligase